jgi:hypothetical protein
MVLSHYAKIKFVLEFRAPLKCRKDIGALQYLFAGQLGVLESRFVGIYTADNEHNYFHIIESKIKMF